MSEMKRAASALVETRVESFESLHPLEESRARLGAALDRQGIEPDDVRPGAVVHLATGRARPGSRGRVGVVAALQMVVVALLGREAEEDGGDRQLQPAWVRRVEQVDIRGVAHFGLADRHHDHTICQRCGAIEATDGCLLDSLAGKRTWPFLRHTTSWRPPASGSCATRRSVQAAATC